MIAFGLYLLKVSLCLAAFYGLYLLLFTTNTFFNLNRVWLLAGLVISFVLPMVDLSLRQTRYDVISFDSVVNSFHESDDMGPFPKVRSDNRAIDYVFILSMIYFGGLIFVLSRFLLFTFRLIRIKNRSETHSYGNIKIIKTKMPLPFSFLDLIFVPEKEINAMIIEHEKAHINQFHWIDLLLMETGVMLLWFNPMVGRYKRSMKIQHEYLADAFTLGKGVQPQDYLACMLSQLQLETASGPISHFYSQSIKQRIAMITKNKTSVRFYTLYLVLVPIVFGLLVAFSNRPSRALSNVSRSVTVLAGEDKPSIAPVELTKVKKGTSGFGKRWHPILKKIQFHTGIDFEMPEGEVVMAAADGIVMESFFHSERGNYVVVKHGNIYTTSYSHLRNAVVKAGDKIAKGQTLGYVGSTGWSTGAHLHYEVLKNGRPVDPIRYF